jgi:cobalamin biosynthesis Mg chelatase CobN
MNLTEEGFKMTISDGLMIFAVFAAPFLAIFAQRKIDENKEKRRQKLLVFRTLMATRANKLSVEHVQALNSIDLFFDKSGAEKKIVEKWDEYLDHLVLSLQENDPDYKVKLEAWTQKGNDFLSDLLSLMGESLGYHFDKVKLKKGIYFPKGHGDIELDNFFIRKGMVNIMAGKTGFPVRQFSPLTENNDEQKK